MDRRLVFEQIWVTKRALLIETQPLVNPAKRPTAIILLVINQRVDALLTTSLSGISRLGNYRFS
ncbi:hypothetical protein HISP_16631 [Haloarcula hispanica N601]|uniref:Uncharacterized protein n=2 Tax=Haloarcula hispanica TaxID=51589 RepID=W0GDS9_HALHI|nr:hypothetical protein HAH_4283 [Haloarcula hispanica ATCC 33960]AHF55882.1 hypothetical protein HISP_16631 [Haloarcula hispanica N601]